MKKNYHRITTLCLMLLVTCMAMAQSVTAVWDFQNVNPSTISETNIQGTTGTVASTVDGIVLTVDATSGKLQKRTNASDAQFNNGTKIQVPVVSTNDVVTVVSYPGFHYYTVGGEAAAADNTEYTAKTADVTAGYVEIVATVTSYLYSIQVVQQQGKIMEKKLYSTTFTEWGDYTTKANTSVTTATWTTKYSKEQLTFSIYDTQIGATNFKISDFPNWTGGMLMAAKQSDPYITTSALASITKVMFIHGATGSKRGWKLEAKGDGDDDWVTISEAVANPTTGATVEAEVNRTNCQLRFTNLNSSQNAYLFALDIYGNVDMSKMPMLDSFQYNGTTYQAADIFEEDNNGDQVATIKIAHNVAMPTAEAGLTDITFDNGEQSGDVTYEANADNDSTTVTINVTANDKTVAYKALFVRKPYYTVSYYYADGTTVIGTQQVEEDNTIANFAYGESDVTVAEGKKFRGWFVPVSNSASKRKITTDEVIVSDFNLYATVTDIETQSTTARYVYDLKDKYFYPEDHEALVMTNGRYNDSTHGYAFNQSSSVKLLVGGNANITLGLCAYGSGDLVVKTEAGDSVTTVSAKAESDGKAVMFKYEGDATTLVITSSATYYIHNIIIANTADNPVAKNEAGWYVVKAGDADNFLSTLDVANANASSDSRTYIFLPDGTYDLGNTCLTTISGDNISIIGQSMKGTIIKNESLVDDIGKSETLLNTANNTYLQDLTLQNALPYYEFLASGAAGGRAVCLQDKGSQTICKNVEMLSYQDTYYSNKAGGDFYFETSNIHGTVDFICGEGDAFFNNCTLTVEKRKADGTGECTITAPSTFQKSGDTFGYVFSGCTIDNKAASFNYGRAWSNEPMCAYINTTIKNDKLTTNRWTLAGMNVVANKFVEYNTMDESGTVTSPPSNKLKFTKDTNVNEMETILTSDEAAAYALDKVFTNWSPADLAAQKAMGELTLKDGTITWAAVDGAKCYAVFKNDVFQAFTSNTTYSVDDVTATYAVRAANEMGGLGEAATVTGTDGINNIEAASEADTIDAPAYNLMGLQVKSGATGLLIKGGKKVIVK